MNELISIIVPVFNVENYIKRCIESLINQTYTNIEIILVDDGSTDKSKDICDEYSKKDKRIIVIHKKNGGLSDARNIGIEASKGNYISFVDSDDYVTNNYVEFLYTLIIDSNSDIAMGKHYIVYDKRIINTGSGNKLLLSPKEALEKILYSDDLDVSAWAKLYKKSLFENIKFPVGRLYEDSATTYKLIDSSKKITFYSVPIYYYIIRKNSITNYKFDNKKFDLILSTKEMRDYVVNKYPSLTGAAERRLMYAYLSTLTQLVRSNDNNKRKYDELIIYIKKNRKKILKNKKVPKRDKVALYTTYFGYRVFKLIWTIYCILTGRK